MLKKLKQLFATQNKEILSKHSDLPFTYQKESIKNAEALKNIGDEYFKNRDLAQAELYFKQSLALDSAQFEVHKNLGIVYYYQRKLDEAIVCYNQAIALKPDYPEAYSNRGLALNDLNKFEEAVNSLNHAITLKPDFAFAYNNRGIALKNLNKFEEALESYNRAIELKPDFVHAHNNKGTALKNLDRPKEALLSYSRAIKLDPNYAEAYFNKGELQNSLRRFNNALKCYDHAIELNPQFAEAYSNRALALKDLTLYDEAHASLNRAIELKPDSALVYNNLGLLSGAQDKLEAAIPHYQHAIALKLDCSEAYINLGETLTHLKRYPEALACYDRLIALKPDHAEALVNRGMVLKELKRFDEAIVSFEKAMEYKPDIDMLHGLWFETKIVLCDWTNYDKDLAHLESKIRQGENAAAAMLVLWCYGDPELQLKAVKNQLRAQTFKKSILPPLPQHPKHDRMRIGYFSADFSNHPVAFLTAELFETHDKSKFELIAFSLASAKDDPMRERIERAFDQFIDVSKLSIKEIALMARDLEIDIAVDLGGYTSYAQPGIFALRAAPVQINYIGYPGTMGVEFMDYIIADATIVPKSHQQYYAEKIVYLPSFQANDTKRTISSKKFSRKELGLPTTGFVFCSFNNLTKLNPYTFDGWMRILKQVEGSVLWLVDDNITAVNNLKKEAGLRGVDSGRLIFAKRIPMHENLARYRMADLFLDTLPFNAGTTASDALWAGLPVLTLMGEAFASRMAASLLNAIHLPELITTTQEEYEALAITLATQPDKLDNIKQKLANNRLSTPLFNIQKFTQSVESAYTQMYERQHADLKPNHIEINK